MKAAKGKSEKVAAPVKEAKGKPAAVQPAAKKEAKSQDEGKIKRNLSNYIIYSNEVRDKVRKENPEMKVGEISKVSD